MRIAGQLCEECAKLFIPPTRRRWNQLSYAVTPLQRWNREGNDDQISIEASAHCGGALALVSALATPAEAQPPFSVPPPINLTFKKKAYTQPNKIARRRCGP